MASLLVEQVPFLSWLAAVLHPVLAAVRQFLAYEIAPLLLQLRRHHLRVIP